MPTCKSRISKSGSNHSLSAASGGSPSESAADSSSFFEDVSASLWSLYLDYAANDSTQEAEEEAAAAAAESRSRKYSYQFGWMNNKKFIKQLQKDNIDLAILQSEIGSVHTKRRKKSWKERLLYAIRSNVVQIILCAFVLIDAVIVIAEIILEIKAITSEKQELEDAFVQTASFVNRTFAARLVERGLLLPAFSPELTSSPQFSERLVVSMANVLLALSQNTSIACNVTTSAVFGGQPGPSSPSPSTGSQTPRLRRHAAASVTVVEAGGGGGNRSQLTPTSVFANFQQEFSHAKVLHDVSAVLHFVSIGILGLFVLEVALKIVCLGRNFVREKFEIVDAVVIMISFVADIVFVKLESTEVSVMVLFLLWRIVRVINGLMMHEKQRGEFRIQLQKRARRMSEMKCDSLETERDLQEKHILFLEELCRELGGGEEQIANCKPRFVNISKRQSNNALKSMAAMSAGIFGGIAGAQHRRSLSALTNNLGTPPSTSRQSSALDTIVEDAAATAATSTAAETAPVLDPLGNKYANSTPTSPEVERPIMNGRPASSQQPPPAAEQPSPSQQLPRQGKRNSILQRQFYVEEEPQEAAEEVAPQDVAEDVVENEIDAADEMPDAGRCGFAGGMAAAAAADIRLQDVRVDSGQYTTTGSDSDDEEDPWELQEFNYKFC